MAIEVEGAHGRSDALGGLRVLARMPGWLRAIADARQVLTGLGRAPVFASGDYALHGCEIDRVRLENGRWTGLYELSVTDPAGAASRISLQGTLLPHGEVEPGDHAPADGPLWRLYLPELRLALEPRPPEQALPALPLLTDPQTAARLLERGIRDDSPAYGQLRIAGCEPDVVRYKPGSRCTLCCRLRYETQHADRGWPDVVFVKIYRGNRGEAAFGGLRALWQTSLRRGDVVALPEPLAFIREHNVLVQGEVRKERTLKELLRATLKCAGAGAFVELDDAVRKSAAGLAALHGAPVRAGESRSWDDELAELRGVAGALVRRVRTLDGVVDPFLQRLEKLSVAHPAEPPAPAHGSFRPDQVLLFQGQIGFVDFDRYCQAEPALDVALFLSTIRDLGVRADARGADGVDALCERFLAAYEHCRPISRQRVALWEALNLLLRVLERWTKAKEDRLDATVLALERFLRTHPDMAPK